MRSVRGSFVSALIQCCRACSSMMTGVLPSSFWTQNSRVALLGGGGGRGGGGAAALGAGVLYAAAAVGVALAAAAGVVRRMTCWTCVLLGFSLLGPMTMVYSWPT